MKIPLNAINGHLFPLNPSFFSQKHSETRPYLTGSNKETKLTHQGGKDSALGRQMAWKCGLTMVYGRCNYS